MLDSCWLAVCLCLCLCLSVLRGWSSLAHLALGLAKRATQSHEIPETTVRVFRRHLQVDPDAAEEYIEYLISIRRLDDAAVKLADVLNSETFVSKKGRTNHQLWQWLCELITRNPGSITSLRVDPIVRGGLRRFTDMKGALWCALADYYVRQGNFEKARDVYEEAIRTVNTVRDFSQVPLSSLTARRLRMSGCSIKSPHSHDHADSHTVCHAVARGAGV